MQNKKIRRSFLLSAVCLAMFGGTIWAQDEKSADRAITPLDFQSQRPKTESVKAGGGISSTTNAKITNAKRRKNIAVVTNAKRRYNLVKRVPPIAPKTAVTSGKTTGAIKNTAALKSEELGVTFWRMRPLGADEADAPTFPVKINNQTENWTAERVGSATTFQKGDRVRFTIESSRTGYLYIVNREFYADGTTGDANLIFPTLRTRGGDNRVSAGSLIEIPAATDSVPYFTIKPRREDYAGEELAVIISPIKIPNIEINLRAQAINRENIEKWLKDWGATVDIYDAEDGEGIAYTRTEAEAVNSRALTQEEPLPQTIYRVQVRADAPLFVPFRMQARTP